MNIHLHLEHFQLLGGERVCFSNHWYQIHLLRQYHIWKTISSEDFVVDFLHELNVKWFEAVPSWGDEEEAGVDQSILQVTSLDLSLIDKDKDNDKDEDNE